MRPASFVLIREGDMFLAHERKQDGKIGLPGGIVNEGESPLMAAVREVREEYGILLDPSDLVFVGKVVNEKGREVFLWEYRLDALENLLSGSERLENLLKEAEKRKDERKILILKLSISLLKEYGDRLHPTFELQLRELLFAPPKGAIVSPSSCAPAGIVGNREFLKTVKEAIERALEEGKSAAYVQSSDGKIYMVVAEIQNRAPVCFADFTGETKIEGVRFFFAGEGFSLTEWKEAHERLSETEQNLKRWEELERELSSFLILRVMEKDFALYERLNRKLKSLFWDETGFKRLPEENELKEFIREIEEEGISADELKKLLDY